MNPHEVIVHVEECEHSDMILQLLAERIRQPGEAAYIHSHVEVLPFHIAGADVFRVRGADNLNALGAKTLCRAVTLLS